MLNLFRKNTKVIVWGVVVAFVAWGGYAVSTQLDESLRAPGKIFGREVSHRDYLSAARSVQIFNPPQEGRVLSPAESEGQIWQFLILSREASRRKIEVTDSEVREEITRLFGAQAAGFSRDQYYRLIQNTFRAQPREFEDLVRTHLRIRKLLHEVRKEAGEPEDKLTAWMTDLLKRAEIQIYKADPA